MTCNTRSVPMAHPWQPPWRATREKRLPPMVERRDLQRQFLAEPDAAKLAEVRAQLPAGTLLYALRDNVGLVKVNRKNTIVFREIKPGKPWGEDVGAVLVHSTPWLEIYRLP